MTKRSKQTVYWFERWLHTAHGVVLHRVVDDVLLKKMKLGKDYFTDGNAETVCGKVAMFYLLYLPGLLSRIGMKRCVRCCKKIGIAEGHGNPHNDKKLEKCKGI